MLRSAVKEDEETAVKFGERTLNVGEESPIRISTGHRIQHHCGKCSNPHGHNYEISVEVSGELTEDGWIVDKGDITSIISEWDHKFLLEKGDPLIEAFDESGDGDAVIVLDYPPTAEIMSAVLEERMLDVFPETVTEVSVTIRETDELCAR